MSYSRLSTLGITEEFASEIEMTSAITVEKPGYDGPIDGTVEPKYDKELKETKYKTETAGEGKTITYEFDATAKKSDDYIDPRFEPDEQHSHSHSTTESKSGLEIKVAIAEASNVKSKGWDWADFVTVNTREC